MPKCEEEGRGVIFPYNCMTSFVDDPFGKKWIMDTQISDVTSGLGLDCYTVFTALISESYD